MTAAPTASRSDIGPLPTRPIEEVVSARSDDGDEAPGGVNNPAMLDDVLAICGYTCLRSTPDVEDGTSAGPEATGAIAGRGAVATAGLAVLGVGLAALGAGVGLELGLGNGALATGGSDPVVSALPATAAFAFMTEVVAFEFLANGLTCATAVRNGLFGNAPLGALAVVTQPASAIDNVAAANSRPAQIVRGARLERVRKRNAGVRPAGPQAVGEPGSRRDLLMFQNAKNRMRTLERC
jgi:hypothetical protein